MKETAFKILIVDDHELILQGLNAKIEHAFPEAEVLKANDLKTLKKEIIKNKPDILLLDLMLGETQAFDFFDDILALHPELRIIVLSSNEDSSTVMHFIERGAFGFVGKSEDSSLIINAIKEVLNKRVFLSNRLKKELKELKNDVDQPKENIQLTRREKEVLKEILKGKSNKLIGDTLCITEKTVEHHKSNLYLKFEANNIATLVKKALLQGYS